MNLGQQHTHIGLIRLSTLSMAIACTALSSASFAGSFELTTQNLTARSQANAGLGVVNSGANTLYSNPALLEKQAGTQVSIGAAYSMVNTDISNATATPGLPSDTNKGDMIDDAIIPSAYLSHKTASGATIGIGVFSEFGFNADYEDTFAGRTFGDISKLKTITVAPSIGFAVTDKVNLGFSWNIVKADGKLTSAVSKGIAGSEFDLEGDDVTSGYTVGIYAEPTDSISLGLVHRSQESLNLEGDVRFTVPALAINQSSQGSLKLILPARTELSGSYKPTDKLGLYAGVGYTEWSSVPYIQIMTTTSAGNPKEVFNYENSYNYSLGADYKVSDMLTVRGGIAKDETPTQDNFRSVRLPTTDRMLYAIGASVQISPASSVDVGYSYVQEDTALINQSKTTPFGSNTYKADFDNSANLLLVQYNHKF